MDGKNYFYEIPGVAASGWNMPALYIGTAIILAIEANAIFGKMRGFMESVKAVIHSGLILTVLFALLVYTPQNCTTLKLFHKMEIL